MAIARGIAGALFAVAACSADAGNAPGWSAQVALPHPITSGAVAAIAAPCTLYAFGGADGAAGLLGEAWAWRVGDATWARLPDLPGPARAAAGAVDVRGTLYVVGGYTEAAGGGEASLDRVDAFDPATGVWSAAAPLPIAVDDAVVVAWLDRWIVVVGGRHDRAAVAAVQVWDADAAAWLPGSAPFVGGPVFGAAGAVVANTLVVSGGATGTVGAIARVDGTWAGHLDGSAPATVTWRAVPPGAYRASFRAGAGVLEGAVAIHGGAAEPFDDDGRAYAGGAPLTPSADTRLFVRDGITARVGGALAPAPAATMDTRGLVGCGSELYVIGGRGAGGAATADVWRYTP